LRDVSSWSIRSHIGVHVTCWCPTGRTAAPRLGRQGAENAHLAAAAPADLSGTVGNALDSWL
jgi:hypothetical protein